MCFGGSPGGEHAPPTALPTALSAASRPYDSYDSRLARATNKKNSQRLMVRSSTARYLSPHRAPFSLVCTTAAHAHAMLRSETSTPVGKGPEILHVIATSRLHASHSERNSLGAAR